MKKTAKIWLSIICVALVVASLAACSRKSEQDKMREQGYDLVIYYDCSPGAFNSMANVKLSQWYKLPSAGTGVRIYEPGVPPFTDEKDKYVPSYAEHFLEGWYTEPTFENKWDFAEGRATESMTLYAKWLENFRYELYYIDADGSEQLLSKVGVAQGATYPANNTPAREGYTFEAYCTDSTLSTEYNLAQPHPGTVVDGALVGQVQKIYTRWIEGVYTLVRKPSDLLMNAVDNYYLMNDLDFSEIGNNGKPLYEWFNHLVNFNGKIRGNGKTIRGVTLNYTGANTPSNYGLFASLGKDAELRDVTFEEVTLTVRDIISKPHNIGLLAGTIARETTFVNVSVSGKIDILELKDDTLSSLSLGILAGQLNQNARNGLTANITYSYPTDRYSITLGENQNNLVIVPNAQQSGENG